MARNEHRDASQSRSEQFMHLFLANQRRIYSFILTLVPNINDADDLLQETASLMWQKFATFTPGTDFAAWGLSMARFLVMNFYKKRKLRGHATFDEVLMDSVASEISKTNEELDVRHEALRACLAKLPETARRLIEMRYAAGVTAKALAEQLSKSADSVYKALSRIHNSLLRCVERRLEMERRR